MKNHNIKFLENMIRIEARIKKGGYESILSGSNCYLYSTSVDGPSFKWGREDEGLFGYTIPYKIGVIALIHYAEKWIDTTLSPDSDLDDVAEKIAERIFKVINEWKKVDNETKVV